MTSNGEVLIQILLVAGFFIPAILFLLTQQNTLKAIRPENRELGPGLVWLQVIPVFNLYWMFVVVTRIADSISKENVSFQDDSILGIPDYDAVKALGNRPTYKIGMTCCSLFILDMVLVWCEDYFPGLHSLQGLVGLSMMVCWIIYWVKLAENKRKLQRLNKVASIAGDVVRQ
jgi:hypothetical protein